MRSIILERKKEPIKNPQNVWRITFHVYFGDGDIDQDFVVTVPKENLRDLHLLISAAEELIAPDKRRKRVHPSELSCLAHLKQDEIIGCPIFPDSEEDLFDGYPSDKLYDYSPPGVRNFTLTYFDEHGTEFTTQIQD